MSTCGARTRVGKYELGRTLGEGSFAKVKFARDSRTGDGVAIKILDKSQVLKHKMVEQIKREISTMKLIKHPNVVQLHEVMASKTKIYIVLEFVQGGELFDKIPENLLLDSFGVLKVSDFGLSTFSPQMREEGLLHTTCGTPNYVAPEIDRAEFSFPTWFSSCAKKFLKRILDPNPRTRITIPEILKDDWFKKGYKAPDFQEEEEVNLDDVDAVFSDSKEHLVMEKKQKPESMNAFALISQSSGFNLGNLFEQQAGVVKRETRFTSQRPANEIMSKIEEAAKPLGFNVQKHNYKMKLKGDQTGRKGHLSVATEVFEVAPTFHVVELRKTGGDTLEFQKFYKSFSTGLKDIVWIAEEIPEQ
ncbi:uncharacterized protein A4U43_C10F2610 [Asparagus officinalis]|uniref:non-specific serine/threonine protein kinase n=1 Tax=Asparagus officinalis TaxID=4686 RepID=A0A5P1E032_ASPOF|nr:uncharacterized protein A4U43_C10F2610 [Asparagus officinalis]